MKKGFAVLAIGLGFSLLLMVNYESLTGLWRAAGVPADVVAEAKRKVKEPVMPAPPSASAEIEGYDEKYAELQVPDVVSTGPLGIPQLTMRTQRVLIGREPRVRIKSPSSVEVSAWQAETARLSAEYQSALQEEVNVTQAERSKEFRETLESWVKIVGGGIGCLVGCVTFVVTIRKERRETIAAALGSSAKHNGEADRKIAAQQAAAPDGGPSHKQGDSKRRKSGRRG